MPQSGVENSSKTPGQEGWGGEEGGSRRSSGMAVNMITTRTSRRSFTLPTQVASTALAASADAASIALPDAPNLDNLEIKANIEKNEAYDEENDNLDSKDNIDDAGSEERHTSTTGAEALQSQTPRTPRADISPLLHSAKLIVKGRVRISGTPLPTPVQIEEGLREFGAVGSDDEASKKNREFTATTEKVEATATSFEPCLAAPLSSLLSRRAFCPLFSLTII